MLRLQKPGPLNIHSMNMNGKTLERFSGPLKKVGKLLRLCSLIFCISISLHSQAGDNHPDNKPGNNASPEAPSIGIERNNRERALTLSPTPLSGEGSLTVPVHHYRGYQLLSAEPPAEPSRINPVISFSMKCPPAPPW